MRPRLTGILGAPVGPLAGPRWGSKKAEKSPFFDPCGVKSRGSGGAPPTHLILLRNQWPAPALGPARVIASRGGRTHRHRAPRATLPETPPALPSLPPQSPVPSPSGQVTVDGWVGSGGLGGMAIAGSFRGKEGRSGLWQ